MAVFFLFLYIYSFFAQFRENTKNDFLFHFYIKRSRNSAGYATIRNYDRFGKFKSVTSIDRRESLKSENLLETFQILLIRENDSKI